MSTLDDLRTFFLGDDGAMHEYRQGPWVKVIDVREALRSDKAVTVIRDVATAHALVPNGIVPGSFFQERHKCVVCGEVDDLDHPIRMGLRRWAGGEDV